MYLAVDIGGTKTLLASFDEAGVIQEQVKFPTPQDYELFLKGLESNVASLSTKDFQKGGVAVPGRLDRQHGLALGFGNLPWENVNIQADIERITHCPVLIENDANLAGLSEAMMVKHEFKKVLYVTISTGIGTGIIINGIIDPNFADSEGGQMLLEHDGKLQQWEDFASGKAVFERFGKRASDIDAEDTETWQRIAHDIALGLIDLIAVIQPEVIVFGGGLDTNYEKFIVPLTAELKRYEMPLVPIPQLRKAARPEEAVIYGCYDLIKAHDASAAA